MIMFVSEYPTVMQSRIAFDEKYMTNTLEYWRKEFDSQIVGRGIDPGATSKVHLGSTNYPESCEGVQLAMKAFVAELEANGWQDVELEFKETPRFYGKEIRSSFLQKLYLMPATPVFNYDYPEVYVTVKRPQ